MPKLQRAVTIIDAILDKEPGRDINVLPELMRMSGFDVETVSLNGNSSKDTLMENLLLNDNRFIHISCHGDKDGLYFNGDRQTHVGISDIEKYIRKNNKKSPLAKKFLTVSACGSLNLEFWKNLNEITGISCVVAPMGKVDFAESSFFYSAFYFSLFKHPSCSSSRKTDERIIDYVDTFQKVKAAYLALGGYGAFRLCFWWEGTLKEII